MLYLVDFYEGSPEIVATANTRKEIKKELIDFFDETDGECNLMIFDGNDDADTETLTNLGLI